MNVAQAIEHAEAVLTPALFSVPAPPEEERVKNEEAISALIAGWKEGADTTQAFTFDLVRDLADRNRRLCDDIGSDSLRNLAGQNLARNLSDRDLIHGIAVMQGRDDATVATSAGPGLRDLGVAYTEAPVSGTVMGIDLETTSRDPDRGYIVNLGVAFMELAPKAQPHDEHAAYFGIPERYETIGVPLSEIHHISWSDIKDKPAFRDDTSMQQALLAAVCAFPIMAHNASFEDSWLMLHLDGYAEARRNGRVTIIDTRDICRRIDVDGRALPRESRPNALENWARRRNTLAADESERHLGLEDVILMFRTVQAEFALRNMFPEP